MKYRYGGFPTTKYSTSPSNGFQWNCTKWIAPPPPPTGPPVYDPLMRVLSSTLLHALCIHVNIHLCGYLCTLFRLRLHQVLSRRSVVLYRKVSYDFTTIL